MKEPFSRFALRFPLALGLGAVMLLAHGPLADGPCGAVIPRNTSPWELSKLAFFPLLLALCATARHSGGMGKTLRAAALPVTLAALGMAAVLTLLGPLAAGTSTAMLLWVALTALTLAMAERWSGNAVGLVLLAALAAAYLLFSFRPPLLGPFLEPGDVAAMAPIAW